MNFSQEGHNGNEKLDELDSSNSKVITFKHFFTNLRVVMASLSAIMAMTFMLFTFTTLSNYLLSVGITEH